MELAKIDIDKIQMRRRSLIKKTLSTKNIGTRNTRVDINLKNLTGTLIQFIKTMDYLLLYLQRHRIHSILLQITTYQVHLLQNLRKI